VAHPQIHRGVASVAFDLTWPIESPFFGCRRRVEINERKSAAQEIVGCEIHQEAVAIEDSRLKMAAADWLSHIFEVVDESTTNLQAQEIVGGTKCCACC
jgi:hypothetical protein